jgi:hypothetical protein
MWPVADVFRAWGWRSRPKRLDEGAVLANFTIVGRDGMTVADEDVAIGRGHDVGGSIEVAMVSAAARRRRHQQPAVRRVFEPGGRWAWRRAWAGVRPCDQRLPSRSTCRPWGHEHPVSNIFVTLLFL